MTGYHGDGAAAAASGAASAAATGAGGGSGSGTAVVKQLAHSSRSKETTRQYERVWAQWLGVLDEQGVDWDGSKTGTPATQDVLLNAVGEYINKHRAGWGRGGGVSVMKMLSAAVGLQHSNAGLSSTNPFSHPLVAQAKRGNQRQRADAGLLTQKADPMLPAHLELLTAGITSVSAHPHRLPHVALYCQGP